MSTTTEVATFSAGCFWGVQYLFKKEFGDALITTRVGYTGGKGTTTTYEDVCTGTTGHAEALEIVYDPTKTNYEALVTYFYRIHEPVVKYQINDKEGNQYLSAIWYHSPAQKKTAEDVAEKIKGHYSGPIVTELNPASIFIAAEDYHQNYLDINPDDYFAHKHHW